MGHLTVWMNGVAVAEWQQDSSMASLPDNSVIRNRIRDGLRTAAARLASMAADA